MSRPPPKDRPFQQLIGAARQEEPLPPPTPEVLADVETLRLALPYSGSEARLAARTALTVPRLRAALAHLGPDAVRREGTQVTVGPPGRGGSHARGGG